MAMGSLDYRLEGYLYTFWIQMDKENQSLYPCGSKLRGSNYCHSNQYSTCTYSLIDWFCLDLLEFRREVDCLHASLRVAVITRTTFHHLKQEHML